MRWALCVKQALHGARGRLPDRCLSGCVVGINDAGQIVGAGSVDGTTHVVVLTPR